MRRRHLVLLLGLIAALAAAVPVLAGSGVSGPTKRAIKKEVARQIAKLQLPPGPEGKQGLPGAPGAPGEPGAPGTPDTSKFFEKIESDARYVAANPGGVSFAGAIFTHHVVLSNTGAFSTVLTLPGGLEAQCASNDSTQSYARLESTSNFVGSLQYNTTTAGYTENTGVKKGAATAAFGGGTYNVARYQIMDSNGSVAPTRVWSITITVLKDSVANEISGGPHCFAVAIAGPA